MKNNDQAHQPGFFGSGVAYGYVKKIKEG